MKRISLFLPLLAAALFAVAAPSALAGSQGGAAGFGQSCVDSRSCQPDLMCEFEAGVGGVNSQGVAVSADGRPGTCVAAKSSDGDDCNQGDCNLRVGLSCNSGSKPIVGSSWGECKPRQAVGGPCNVTSDCRADAKCDGSTQKCVKNTGSTETPAEAKSWQTICTEKAQANTSLQGSAFTNAVEACLDEEGKTCIAESECLKPLICNTAETNLGGLFRSGRSGACRLPSSVGGDCEELLDCTAGLSCNVRQKKCFNPSEGTNGTVADDDAGSGSGLSSGNQTIGTDEAGRPNFGLQFFRGTDTGLRTDSPQAFITGMIRTVLSILALLLVAMIVYGGVMYMTAAGSEPRAKTGKQIITFAIVGITIVAAAFIISEFVIRALIAV